MSILLAIDGDSFAHRAYHALPKSIRQSQRIENGTAAQQHLSGILCLD